MPDRIDTRVSCPVRLFAARNTTETKRLFRNEGHGSARITHVRNAYRDSLRITGTKIRKGPPLAITCYFHGIFHETATSEKEPGELNTAIYRHSVAIQAGCEEIAVGSGKSPFCSGYAFRRESD
jgi:hypothetical protein